MLNVAYIISFVEKAIAFEWIAEEIDPKRFKLTFIFLNPGDSAIEEHMRQKGIDTFRVPYLGKKNIPKAILATRKILKQQKIDVVHAHLFDACLVGLTAAKLCGIKRRIHTRHNATIHHNYHPHMVKYDRYINRLSTDIVSITKNVTQILTEMEGVREEKITLVHHGFKLRDFANPPIGQVENLRKRYLRDDRKGPVIGIIARYIHWKGIQHIIPAFAQVLEEYPDATLVLANADGPYKAEIQQLLKQLPGDSFVEIPFEANIFSLYHLFDIYVHTPIDEQSEAFGQTYVEALAAGIPSVFTLSGIARDFIGNEQHALVVPFQDENAIAQAIHRLLNEKELCEQLVANGRQEVNALFTLDKMIHQLEALYER